MVKFELVVPAYNEALNLQKLIERVSNAAETSGFQPEDFQLIIVENGSRDSSKEELFKLKMSALGKWFQLEILPVNYGYGHGIFAGLKRTTAPIIGWSHADLQCDPLDAFKAYKLLTSQETATCLVKGKRSGRLWKDRFVSKVFEFFAYAILKMRLKEINAQPKVFPRQLLDNLDNPPPGFAFDLYVLYSALKEHYSILSTPVVFPPRIHGVSNWAFHFTTRYRTILGMIRYMFQLRQDA